jgi:oligopeptide/dipeptide ABC transporter ATP-binding protein
VKLDSELVRVEDMQVLYATDGDPVLAVDGVDLTIDRGEIVGIIGESGSGKTTLVRAVAGLLGRNSEVSSGRVWFDGDLVYSGSKDARARLRGARIGVVFQDARASLDPVMTVGAQVGEVLRTHREISRREGRETVLELFGRLGFDEPRRVYESYPFQLSGGMCQRAAIAAAVVAEPDLLIADECTSALDVTTQAEVAALFSGIAREANRTLLFVTHDILLAAQWCTRLVVMYAGQVVEDGAVGEVVGMPRHPYTKALIDAVPLWESRRQLTGIAGSPPSMRIGAVGCRFFARCPRATSSCAAADIEWTSPGGQHGFRCIRPLEALQTVA